MEKLYPDTNKGRRYMAVTAHRYLVGDYTHDRTQWLAGLTVEQIAAGLKH